MRSVLTLLGVFNLCDWVVAFGVAGTAWRIEGKDNRRTLLAVGLAVFFFGLGIARLAEFVNLIVFQDSLRSCLGVVDKQFNNNLGFIYFFRTLTYIFAWFAVSLEHRSRKGILSGGLIRNLLFRLCERLR